MVNSNFSIMKNKFFLLVVLVASTCGLAFVSLTSNANQNLDEKGYYKGNEVVFNCITETGKPGYIRYCAPHTIITCSWPGSPWSACNELPPLDPPNGQD